MKKQSKSSIRKTPLKVKKIEKITIPKVALFSWKDFIPMLSLLISFILIIIGLFTQMFVIRYTSGVSYSIDPMTYFIKGVAEQFNSATPGFNLWIEIGRLVFTAVPWLLAIIPTLIIFGFSIYKIIRYVFYHDLVEFDYKKLTRWMLAFVLPYILFIPLVHTGVYYNTKLPSASKFLTLGYGPKIVLAGACLLFATNIIATKNEFKESPISFLLNKIPYALFIVIAATSTLSLIKVSNGIDKTFIVSAYTFVPLLDIFTEFPKDVLILLISFTVAPIFIPFIVRANNNSTRIVFSSLLNVFALGTLSHHLFALNNPEYKPYFTAGYSIYCLVIFSSLILAISITSAILKRVKVIN